MRANKKPRKDESNGNAPSLAARLGALLLLSSFLGFLLARMLALRMARRTA